VGIAVEFFEGEAEGIRAIGVFGVVVAVAFDGCEARTMITMYLISIGLASRLK
jgi:hypothetical protein